MGQAIIYVPMPTAPVSVPQAVSGGQIQFLPQVELKQPSKKPAHGVELTRPDYRQKAEVAVAMMGLAQVPTYSYRGEQFSN